MGEDTGLMTARGLSQELVDRGKVFVATDVAKVEHLLGEGGPMFLGERSLGLGTLKVQAVVRVTGHGSGQSANTSLEGVGREARATNTEASQGGLGAAGSPSVQAHCVDRRGGGVLSGEDGRGTSGREGRSGTPPIAHGGVGRSEAGISEGWSKELVVEALESEATIRSGGKQGVSDGRVDEEGITHAVLFSISRPTSMGS
jgi:hypothetical protein